MDKPQPPRCAICGTPDQLLRCAKCKAVYYCSTIHQHSDWPSHRHACRVLARQKNNNKMQQLQQAVAATTLDSSGGGGGGGGAGAPAMANCSTAQMMTPAAQAQSWPDEVDNLLNYFDTTPSMDIDDTTATAANNISYGSNGYANMDYNRPPPPPYHATAQANNHINHHHYHQHLHQQHHHSQNEKSSSYQIGLTDSSFMGTGSERRYEDLCRNIINDMNQYGLSVVDDFLGMEKGLKILNEVRSMYNAGAFHDGQLVHNTKAVDAQLTVRGDKIRGDKIKWVGGNEPGCSNVWYLTNQIDSVVYRVNTMKDNGILGNYHIRERTRAMVACYPGSGTHYVMHVDNPNKDGRVITAIYYLNLNWDASESGGILRIRPTPGTTVADIEPKFDRLIFFWSDIRNPHEVQPAHRTRYAITVWYFDAKEREEALNRAKLENSKTNNATTSSTQQAEPDSTTPAASATITTTQSANKALTPASMSTGSAINANVASNSCAASSEICT